MLHPQVLTSPQPQTFPIQIYPQHAATCMINMMDAMREREPDVPEGSCQACAPTCRLWLHKWLVSGKRRVYMVI